MSLFGAITESDRTRWQAEAAQSLAGLLAEARAAGLPAVRWTLDTGRRFHGEVVRMGSWSAEDQRAAFEVWAAHLGADRQPERTVAGRGILRAVAERGPVSITLRAELDE